MLYYKMVIAFAFMTLLKMKEEPKKSITEDDSILATNALIKRVSIVIKNDQSFHKKHNRRLPINNYDVR